MYPYRFKIILIIFILFFAGIVVRLFQLQVIENNKYKGISKNRRIATQTLEATRGSVFDRNGVPLAMDQHAFDITVHYKNLLYWYALNKNEVPRIAGIKAHNNTKKTCAECHEEQDKWVDKLSQLLGIPHNKLLSHTKQIVEKVERLRQSVEQKSGRITRIREEADYYPIASDVAWEKVIQIEINQQNYPGIRVTPRPTRIYPQRELASHILGYMSKLNKEEWEAHSERWNNFTLNSNITGTDTSLLLYEGYAQNDYIGRSGVELQYEDELHGGRGKRFEEITCKNTQVEKVILERPPVSGNNLYLTIDARIQAYAENSLGKNQGAVIVMEPWTGEILAMASYPRFNPNNVNENFEKLIKNPSKPFLNRAIQGALPPGSIFKVITAAAALESNRISTRTTYECRGYTDYKNIIFKCWAEYGHGLITIEDAIPHSCNVFFYETARISGGDPIYTRAKDFGVGEKTGIDLPYEKSGNMPKITNTATAMNVAIGQGALLTTPLQLCRVYAAVANGGTLVQPHLLSKLTNDKGEVVRIFEPEKKQKLSLQPAIIDVLRATLHDVVSRGTAKKTGLDIYKVAGKTGTAETGRQKKNHAWFVGYVPYDNPRYCFVILVENTPGHGADIAGPIAKELMSCLFPEFNEAS